jgi:hypothetical protein
MGGSCSPPSPRPPPASPPPRGASAEPRRRRGEEEWEKRMPGEEEQWPRRGWRRSPWRRRLCFAVAAAGKGCDLRVLLAEPAAWAVSFSWGFRRACFLLLRRGRLLLAVGSASKFQTIVSVPYRTDLHLFNL